MESTRRTRRLESSGRADQARGRGGRFPAAANDDVAMRLTGDVLDELFGPRAARSFTVRLWDGTRQAPSGPPAFTLVLRRPGALRRMLLPPTTRRIGEAYVRGDFEIEGDVEAAGLIVDRVSAAFRSPGTVLRLAWKLIRLPRDGDVSRIAVGAREAPRRAGEAHSRGRDAASVRYHYDVGNDFYDLWLDRRMVYSCGYFPTGEEDLDAAQAAKLELVCRKLDLRPAERMLDIGAGWGGLVLHAARRHEVRALGITLSAEQAMLARERTAAAGLTDRCGIEICDYRDLPEASRFDKIASIGMVEHVGRANLRAYFREAFDRLEPGGLFLNHGIVLLGPARSATKRFFVRRLRPLVSFIDRYIFPDGELVTPAEMIAAAEAAGFELRDAESLREHYVATLRLWIGRLEERREEAIALVGEPTYRAWRLYMGGCARAFDTGRIGVVQLLLARPDAAGRVTRLRSRPDLYREPLAAPAGDDGHRFSRPGELN